MVMNVKLKENWIAAFDEFDIREVNNSFKQPVNIIAVLSHDMRKAN